MEKFIVGSYSDNKTSIPTACGAGLSIISLDDTKGTLSIDYQTNEIDNPSYFYINKKTDELYICSERCTVDGEITVYDYKNKIIKKQFSSNGKATCHVNYDDLTKTIYYTNYLSGDIGLYHLDTEEDDYYQFKGKSINKERQESPHPHCLIFHKNEIFVSDLGTDLIYIFDRTISNFLLKETIQVPKGYGPRHLLTFNNHLYVVCELNSIILNYSYDQASENWVLIQECATEMSELMNISNPAALKVVEKKDYRIITVSNRFSNGLRQFKVKKDGNLHFIKDIRLEGVCPRDFCFSKDGKWVLVAEQDSNFIELYKVNDEGIIEDQLVSTLKINTPVCIKTIDL